MRTFDEARAELERRNYKVIAPFFVANKVRVQRPDGSEELVRDRFHLATWARKELGIIDPPASGTPHPNPPETIFVPGDKDQQNGAQRARAARAARTVSTCAFVGGGVMLALNVLFGFKAGFPGGAVGGAIGAAVGSVVGIGINKLRGKSRRTPKLGFLGWAFSGGLYFGKVPGSNLGGIGAAFIGAGALPAFRAINTYPNAPMVLIASLALGGGLLAGGYGKYCSVRDSKTDQEDKAYYVSPRTADQNQNEDSAPPESANSDLGPGQNRGKPETPVSVRTFEEAKTELERRNYKVIAPFFVANKVRVQRPDGSEESVPNRLYLPAWASKELGVTDQPNNGRASPFP